MRLPLLLPALGFAAGIFLSRITAFHWFELAFALLFFAAVAFLREAWLRQTAIFLVFLVLGAARGSLDSGRVPLPDLAASDLHGCVVESESVRNDRGQFVLEVAPDACARVSMEAPGAYRAPLQYGQRITVPVKVHAVRGFHNPGTFDAEEWLARRNIYWQASVPRGKKPRVLPGACGSVWRRPIEGLRSRALSRIDEIYPGDGYRSAMMRGLLIGDGSGIRKAWIEDFRRTGTYHALVISGSHITFVCGLFLLWRRLYGWGERSLLIFACLVAWFYAMVAGGAAPVTRAAAGFVLFTGARLLYRAVSVLNLLAAVAMLFLAIDPAQLFDSSFQLSFLAVAAMGAFAANDARQATPQALSAALERRLIAETITLTLQVPAAAARAAIEGIHRLWKFASDTFLLSAAVQVGLALPLALYFHRLSLTGLSANVVVVPLLSMAVPLGFLAVFTGWHWSAALAGALLDWSQSLAAWHARFEPAHRIPDPPLWLAATVAISVVGVAVCRALRLRWWPAPMVTGMVGVALLVIHPFAPIRIPASLELAAIDVGQGESLLLQLPDGSPLLIDAGGLPHFGRARAPSFDIGEEVVSPYLWARGLQRLEVLALTHLHEDHAGGALAVMENFRPRELWTGFCPDIPLWRAIRSKAGQLGIRVRELSDGDHWSHAGVSFQVLAPATRQEWSGKTSNNDSLVLRVSYGRHSILLTGDVEGPVVRRLLDEGKVRREDVLKVAHHGSKRSNPEDWLKAMRPAVALISAGRDNSYGLPNPAVVNELRSLRAYTLRTDSEGLVTVRSDGRYLSVETYGLR